MYTPLTFLQDVRNVDDKTPIWTSLFLLVCLPALFWNMWYLAVGYIPSGTGTGPRILMSRAADIYTLPVVGILFLFWMFKTGREGDRLGVATEEQALMPITALCSFFMTLLTLITTVYLMALYALVFGIIVWICWKDIPKRKPRTPEQIMFLCFVWIMGPILGFIVGVGIVHGFVMSILGLFFLTILDYLADKCAKKLLRKTTRSANVTH